MTADIPTLANESPISESDAGNIARACFGLEAPASQMDGLADLSFRVGSGESGFHVLKVSPIDADRGVLEMQHALLVHLGRVRLAVEVPVPVPDLFGQGISAWSAPDGHPRAVRLLRFLPGQLVCEGEAPDARLLRSIGRGLAEIDKALLDFEHPGALRTHPWDLACAEEQCADAPLDEETRGLVEPALADYRHRVLPELPGLRRSVIHGDVNDHNLLVRERPGHGTCFSGLIDFGDALHGPIISNSRSPLPIS